MTQPTFADGPQVPLMVEGLIDPPTLNRLFADLESAAVVTGVREKGGPAEFAGVGELPPTAALERLLARTARAVQIRYRFDGHEWTDTVLAVPGGFRVVRCRH
ncbi:MAG: hypothetical protein K2X87_03825 [Gemmataceae bacterium]|nr:hypothetical protein [Gemmataceae bacterium]